MNAMVAPSDYEAMGYPVPPNRLSRGYSTVKEMIPGISTEEAMSLVGRVAACIERDDPYGALREATDAPFARQLSSVQGHHPVEPGVRLDVTGGYRLLATLCCDA